MKKLSCILALAILLMSLSISCFAAYPEKTVTVQIGSNPGSTTDLIARQVANKMSKILKQPFVVTNLQGAGGSTMAMNLKNAAPDGYTIGIGAQEAFTINIIMGSRYSFEDFDYLGSLGTYQTCLVTNSKSSYSSMDELIAYSKDNNKAINFSVMGHSDRLILKQLAKKEDFKANFIPGSSGAAIMPAVLGGHVDVGTSGGLHAEYVKSGQMKVIAAFGKRLVASPDIASISERGYPDLSSYIVMAVPKKVPNDIKLLLEQTLQEVAKDPEIIDLVANKIQLLPEFMDSATVTTRLQEAYAAYEQLVKNEY